MSAFAENGEWEKTYERATKRDRFEFGLSDRDDRARARALADGDRAALGLEVLEGAGNLETALEQMVEAAAAFSVPTGVTQVAGAMLGFAAVANITRGTMKILIGASALLFDKDRRKMLAGALTLIEQAEKYAGEKAEIAGLDLAERVLKTVVERLEHEGQGNSAMAERARQALATVQLERLVKQAGERDFAREHGRMTDDARGFRDTVIDRGPRDVTRDYGTAVA